ncbi:MAG: GNAT family N-acetyltransferase [Candidatus Saccharibacteria bacterium]|nr:GNAT family N-acetyltransferase [Moraxellaceae bacterium]
MGGSVGLSDHVKQTLISQLEKRSERLILLAIQNNAFVGLLNGFEGFSTFAARPLLNIHDVFVHASVRGLGVGRELFIYAERVARARGYCKLTLEVLAGNTHAQRLYQAQGFVGYALDEATGHAMFWQKVLHE